MDRNDILEHLENLSASEAGKLLVEYFSGDFGDNYFAGILAAVESASAEDREKMNFRFESLFL